MIHNHRLKFQNDKTEALEFKTKGFTVCQGTYLPVSSKEGYDDDDDELKFNDTSTLLGH